MKFTEIDIMRGLLILGVNPEKYGFTIKDVKAGIAVELEHGLRAHGLDVTHDHLISTLKIALVHLLENPKYYKILKRVGL